MGAKVESCQSLTTPDHFEPVAAEVVICLLGLVAIDVVGQSSVIIYGLAIVHL